jgi:hypothetical protein
MPRKAVSYISPKGRTFETYPSVAAAANALGLSESGILKVCSGTQAYTGDKQFFKWAAVEIIEPQDDVSGASPSNEDEQGALVVREKALFNRVAAQPPPMKLTVAKPVVQVSQEGAVIKTYVSVNKAAGALNVSARSIRDVCNGAQNSTKGNFFKWGYEALSSTNQPAVCGSEILCTDASREKFGPYIGGAVASKRLNISKYPLACAASRALSVHNIAEVGKGKRKHAQGLRFMIKNDYLKVIDSSPGAVGQTVKAKKKPPSESSLRGSEDSDIKRRYGTLTLGVCKHAFDSSIEVEGKAYTGLCKNSLYATIHVNGNEDFLGLFHTEEEAVRKHNELAVRLGMPLCSLECNLQKKTVVSTSEGLKAATLATPPQVPKRKAVGLPPRAPPAPPPAPQRKFSALLPPPAPAAMLPPPEHLGVRKSRRASVPAGGNAFGKKEHTLLERKQHFAKEKVIIIFFVPSPLLQFV